MSEQQQTQSLWRKHFDNIYLVAVLLAILFYFSSWGLAYLFIPLSILLTRIFVNYQENNANSLNEPDDKNQVLSRQQKILNFLTIKIRINTDYMAYIIALIMVYYIYSNSLDLTFILLPVCVLLARFFVKSENKNLTSAFYGSLGGVLLLAACVYIVTSSPDSNDPPAGLVMVNAISFLGAFACWLAGFFAVIRLFQENSPYTKCGTAYASYLFVCLPPGFILVSRLLN